jgi:hypothetical protein
MIRPADNGTIFVRPEHGDGFSPVAGIYVEHDSRLPEIYGEVTHAGANHEGIRDGDLCIYIPHATEPIQTSEGTAHALSERSVCGVYEWLDE